MMDFGMNKVGVVSGRMLENFPSQCDNSVPHDTAGAGLQAEGGAPCSQAGGQGRDSAS